VVENDLLGLPVRPREVDWGPLTRPRRAAFIGAADREGSRQRAQFGFFRQRVEPLGCEVIGVHPSKTEIDGAPAVPSVLDIDGDVDVAVVLARDAVPAVEECVRKGVAFVIVLSAGFAEPGAGADRAARERLAGLGRGRTRIIGPDTNLNFFERWRCDLPGRKLAIVSQSGFQGRALSQAEVCGTAIQSWATTGGEADLEWADFVSYYAGLPGTGAIATCVEGFRSGRTMMLAAGAAAARGIPIVAITAGRSGAVHDAAFAQSGIVRVDDHDEAIEISGMFCHAPPLTGPDGAAVYALSGGTAAHLAALCAAGGVPVPRLSDAPPAGRAALDAVMDDDRAGMVLVPVAGLLPGMIEPLARDLVKLHAAGRKPILVTWASPVRDDDGYRMLCEAGVPVFHSLTATVRGAKALIDHRRFRTAYRDPFGAVATAPTGRGSWAAAALRAADALDEAEAKSLLEPFGIPVIGEAVAVCPGDAREAAAAAGGPAVLKVLSPDITRRSGLGLVRLGVTAADAPAVYEELIDDASRAVPGAEIRGVLVQPLVTDTVAEVMVGVSREDPFGPVVVFGLGGVFTEVPGDVRFGVPPFGRDRAREMVTGVRGAALLTGARGRPAADTEALVDLVMNVQDLVLEAGDSIAALDLNPVLARPRGRGALAVDALIVPR